MKKYISLVFVFAFLFTSYSGAHEIEILDAANLQIALQKLNVLGSVLYIAAHPDDENTAALAYFSKGRKYRTAYLSLNRGGGGQNLIGPEKGVEVGIIRTQELLSARRIDGAEQYFSRAIDFGYSKTAAESFNFWGKEDVIADVVWIIRKFRPDVIVTRFPSDSSSGHGHHTASGIIAKEAYLAASDPKRYPEQLKTLLPWQAKRLCWNRWRPSQEEARRLPKIDTGEYDPLLGKSYSEMAAESRSMHKSQGFGSAGRRGTRYDYFLHIEGSPASNDLFDGIDTTWDRIPEGRDVGSKLGKILKSFNPNDPAASLPELIGIYKELVKIKDNYWVEIKKKELLRVIQGCAGLWIEAIAGDFAASPGEEIQVTTTVVNRSRFPFTIQNISFPGTTAHFPQDINLTYNDPQSTKNSIRIPENFPISQPYWLRERPGKGLFNVPENNIIGLAENPPSLCAKIGIMAEKSLLEFSIPVLFRWTDRVEGEQYRQFEIRPPVTLDLEDKVCVFTSGSSKEISVKLKSHKKNVSGEVRLKGPDNWRITPALIPFDLTEKYQEKQVIFKVFPPDTSHQAFISAEAEVGEGFYSRSFVEMVYPHIRRQVYFPESRLKAVKVNMASQGNKVGYIMGAGDEVPQGLISLGYVVVDLNDEILETTDLSSFDAVVAGIRAYNTRQRLKHVQEKLLKYVERGGTLIVQYNVSRGLQLKNIGPYPFSIGRDRVSVEEAEVSFLKPAHQLLNFPNKITKKDFEGWVQERGLYFASQWDEKYEAILSAHDPGEADKKGGLLFGRYGKGIFIYTGFSWFRQLPAGVPGAFRLFANLISAGKYHGKSNIE